MFQWFRNLVGKREITYQQGLTAGLIAAPTFTGVPVNEQTAIGIASMWCGLKVLGDTVGMLPLQVFDSRKGIETLNDTHPLNDIFIDPNPEATRPTLWGSAVSMGYLYGNLFIEIIRENSGRPVELWNIHPMFVRVGRNTGTGELQYEITNSISGGAPGEPGLTRTVAAADMIHVPLTVAPDGTVGYRLLVACRETIGYALAAQRYASSLFRNLGRPGGIIEVPATIKLNDVGRTNLKDSFKADTTRENVGSMVLLEDGMTYTQTDVTTNEQLQLKDLQNYFVYEVARLLNIPPFKLHSLDEATWNNATVQQELFLSSTLAPLLEKIECELEKKLLMPSEKRKYCIEFDTHELEKANKQIRYANYKIACDKPFLTVNEVRQEEGLGPIDGGDELNPPAPPAPQQQPDGAQATDDSEANNA